MTTIFAKVTTLTEMDEYILAKYLSIFNYLGTIVFDV